jgi:uncharacterized protein
MWKRIELKLKDYPARVKVARLMVELGLNIDPQGKISCGSIEMNDVKIGRAAGVDRRVVRETVRLILSDAELARLFRNLRPAGSFLRDVAKDLGFSVIEVYADPTKSGVIAGVSDLIAREGVSIRQAVADDPELIPEPKLVVITEKAVSGETLRGILKVPGVSKIATF